MISTGLASSWPATVPAGADAPGAPLLDGTMGRQADEPPMSWGGLTQLMVDTHVLSDWWRVERVQHPVCKFSGNPVLKADMPWERHTYGGFPDSAMYDPVDRKFKLWLHVEQFTIPGRKVSGSNVIGFACSDDGFAWEKPALRLHAYEGTLDNSVCRLTNPPGHLWGCMAVVQDPRPPSAREGRRYEAIGPSPFHDDGQRINGWMSPAWSEDGTTWTLRPGGVRIGAGGGNPSCLWDEDLERYVLFTRQVLEGAGAGSGRYVCRQISGDLCRWSPRRTVLNTAMDPHWPEVESMMVFRHQGIYFGLPQVLENVRRRELTVQLAISRDGIGWERPFPDLPFIPRGLPGSFDAVNTWFAQPVTARDRHWFFYAGSTFHHGSRPSGPADGMKIGVATLPRDRIAGLCAGQETGALLTRPLVVDGDDLVVNASLQDRGGLRAEVVEAFEDYRLVSDAGEAHGHRVDPRRPAVKGFSMTQCDQIVGDRPDHVVRWGGRPLSELRGRVVRLRLHWQVGTLWAIMIR